MLAEDRADYIPPEEKENHEVWFCSRMAVLFSSGLAILFYTGVAVLFSSVMILLFYTGVAVLFFSYDCAILLRCSCPLRKEFAFPFRPHVCHILLTENMQPSGSEADCAFSLCRMDLFPHIDFRRYE